ncbi:MAG: hypothetical protein AAF934_07285 [Bacteroidota bacterium]
MGVPLPFDRPVCLPGRSGGSPGRLREQVGLSAVAFPLRICREREELQQMPQSLTRLIASFRTQFGLKQSGAAMIAPEEVSFRALPKDYPGASGRKAICSDRYPLSVIVVLFGDLYLKIVRFKKVHFHENAHYMTVFFNSGKPDA